MADQFTADEVRVLKALAAGLLNATGGGKSSGGSVASDEELDDKFGNLPIKKNPSPKYWKGESFVGRPFSECDPDYLDAFAKWKEASVYMKEKDIALIPDGEEKKTQAKYAGFDRKDAARARGWAARIRKSGWKPAARPEPVNPFASNGKPSGFGQTDPGFDSGGGDDDFAFGANAEADDAAGMGF